MIIFEGDMRFYATIDVRLSAVELRQFYSIREGSDLRDRIFILRKVSKTRSQNKLEPAIPTSVESTFTTFPNSEFVPRTDVGDVRACASTVHDLTPLRRYWTKPPHASTCSQWHLRWTLVVASFTPRCITAFQFSLQGPTVLTQHISHHLRALL